MLPSQRKLVKKQNLSDAKKHFPYRVKIENLTGMEIKDWFYKHRFYSWKQKGTLGDYFTRDYQTIWFREKEKMTFFILSCK